MAMDSLVKRSSSMDLEAVSGFRCVGRMQVQRSLVDSAQSELGFICGSLPVPTASPPKAFSSASMTQGVRAPHYTLLPKDDDLMINPLDIAQCEDIWGGKWKSPGDKCDALAVSALAGHGDEIDVIAPVDILKQLFKTPYSKARVSVAVHRIGKTLILNQGPDEDREKLAKTKNATLGEKLLYSKFVQQSMHHSSATPAASSSPEFLPTAPSPCKIVDEEQSSCCSSEDLCATLRLPSHQKGKSSVPWGKDKARRCSPVQKSRFLDEDTEEDYLQHETETQQRTPDGFLRVLYWEFQNLRMLLGSDLLVFSNDKHVAVSLHLVETKQQVAPIMWLDAWLDNVMASVPELAICYHHNGVVQGYELLKTDDIFSLKGLSEDGSVFFQPHVVQQNALSVLKFLQENCKHDPGTYWLYKDAGEDMLQLFDLTGVSKSCNTDEMHGSLPARGNRYTLPLAMLLYRIAYSLSRSQESSDVCKCARLFRKCLEFLDHQEHLIIRAITHEQVARLILNCCKEHGSVTQPVLYLEAYEPDETSASVSTGSMAIEELNVPPDKTGRGTEIVAGAGNILSSFTSPVIRDPIHARLAAVHHVSEAILSLRSQRQLKNGGNVKVKEKSVVKRFPLCLCGGIECVTFYDIKSSEFGDLMDQKLRDLVTMLSKSYLALGKVYKEEGQLSRAVEAAKLACVVYASFGVLSAPYGCQYCVPEDSAVGVSNKLVRGATYGPEELGVFWDELWLLIGDIYVKNLILSRQQRAPSGSSTDGELQMAEEVLKEVRRLKKKAGKPGCGVCSSDDCSCHADRISSGSTATSSNTFSSRGVPRAKKSARMNSTTTPAETENQRTTEHEGTTSEGPPQQQFCRNHVCYHLQQVLKEDLTVNFRSALDCYDAAIQALRGVRGASDQLKEALQKKGWACNEVARRVLAVEDLTLADQAFRMATGAFHEVGDVLNVVLVKCNHGYALRDSAEKLVGLISTGTFSNETLEHAICEAKKRYERALECYEAARQQVFSVKAEPKLGEEVVTQLGNTYLRLGMFLATEELRVCQSLSADKAFLKAMDLYKSAGRKQEAAFAHLNFGCHLSYSQEKIQKRPEFRTLKRQVEGHFRKAAQYYREKHTATYLDIQRKLCDFFISSSSSNQILDEAVSHMLDGRLAFSGAAEPPSGQAVVKYLAELQALLKKVLGAAKTCGDDSSSRTRMSKLKEMYRVALRSSENTLSSDLDNLYKLWVS